MDSLVIYPLKHIVPKEKSGNGFPFPYKPSFAIFIPENEVTLIWFSYSLAKYVNFSGHWKEFFVAGSWWIGRICVGKNSRVWEESWRTLHVAPARKQSKVLFSHLGSLRLWQDRFARRHPSFSFCLLRYPGRRSLLHLCSFRAYFSLSQK